MTVDIDRFSQFIQSSLTSLGTPIVTNFSSHSRDFFLRLIHIFSRPADGYPQSDGRLAKLAAYRGRWARAVAVFRHYFQVYQVHACLPVHSALMFIWLGYIVCLERSYENTHRETDSDSLL